MVADAGNPMTSQHSILFIVVLLLLIFEALGLAGGQVIYHTKKRFQEPILG
jgi:hypothetical protein